MPVQAAPGSYSNKIHGEKLQKAKSTVLYLSVSKGSRKSTHLEFGPLVSSVWTRLIGQCLKSDGSPRILLEFSFWNMNCPNLLTHTLTNWKLQGKKTSVLCVPIVWNIWSGASSQPLASIFGILSRKLTPFQALSPGSCLSPISTSEKAHQTVTCPQGRSRPRPRAT